MRSLLRLIERLDHAFRTSPDPVILGQVPPAHRAGGIDQELRGPGELLLLADGVEEPVLAGDLGARITEERERPPHLGKVLACHLGRIHADGHGTDTALRKLGEVLLETP